MDLSQIVFTHEFDDDYANESANDYLQKGWMLIHVGTKLIEILNNGNVYNNTAYVVGATKDQYQEYLDDQAKLSLDDLI